jgi:CBS domain-containing protein
MNIRDILATKGNCVITARPSEKIDTLAHRLRDERIGAVIVSGEGDAIVGIISERDVVHGLAEYGVELLAMSVSELMTRQVKSCRPDDSVKDVMQMMTQFRIRHLPVLDDGRLMGIVSIGDVVKNRLEDMGMEANVLRDIAIARR